MPRNAAKVSPPGGRRVGVAEVTRRLDAVAELLAAGHPRRAIVAECRGRFGLSPRAVDDYLARVRDQWATDREAARPTEQEETIARLMRLARTLEARGAWGPLVACERLLADVRGVRVPDREIARQIDRDMGSLLSALERSLDAATYRRVLDAIQSTRFAGNEAGRPSDLSRLSHEEMATLDSLLAKAQRREPPTARQ